MREIGAYEAKTHLPRLLDEVEAGQSITITKHGRPVAQLVPITPESKPASLLGSVKYRGDIVAPLDEPWDVES